MQFIGYKGITGIEYPDGSVTPTILRSELKEIGYETLEPKILNAADYGVPQRRNRIIFIGYRKGMKKPSYPEPTVSVDHHVSLLDAIGDLISNEALRKKRNVMSDCRAGFRSGSHIFDSGFVAFAFCSKRVGRRLTRDRKHKNVGSGKIFFSKVIELHISRAFQMVDHKQ